MRGIDYIVKEVNFIKGLKQDLETLRTEECYKRHEPSYYEETTYYNWFHQIIPTTLLLSPAYAAFIKSYITEKQNLYTSVKTFIEVFENRS